MKTIEIRTHTKKILADTITPVSIYLKLRDHFPNSIVLEGADYHAGENSYSFVCLNPVGSFIIENNIITENYPDNTTITTEIIPTVNVADKLNGFMQSFKVINEDKSVVVNGIFGYSTFDSVQYFEDIKFKDVKKDEYNIPDVRYSFYKYIVAINHFKNEVTVIENILGDEDSRLDELTSLINNKNFATFPFTSGNNEQSNLTDEEYMKMVTMGKKHCFNGDVIQIVLSRQFSQQFSGDEFNVYRALRSINPSPYLFYFDYGSYKIFGSSPEAQLIINNQKAYINPIAGTYRRTGDDEADKKLAEELSLDPKENAEHVMLVDLARNDLGRNADDVKVESFREIQYYSHVLHMVSKVAGQIPADTNVVKVMGDSFPAGTLSGAPKYKAMELIDKYENQNRGYYGGCLGYIGFNGDFNHAIMIRSFLSKNNRLFYQAGAGVVSESKEENELKEVNNKLMALKKAIEMAETV